MKNNMKFAKVMMIIFGFLFVVCVITSFWNPGQLLFAIISGIMFLSGYSEFKRSNDESEEE